MCLTSIRRRHGKISLQYAHRSLWPPPNLSINQTVRFLGEESARRIRISVSSITRLNYLSFHAANGTSCYYTDRHLAVCTHYRPATKGTPSCSSPHQTDANLRLIDWIIALVTRRWSTFKHAKHTLRAPCDFIIIGQLTSSSARRVSAIKEFSHLATSSRVRLNRQADAFWCASY
jgi:hypothetical protein